MSNRDKNKRVLSRRDFLKTIGATGVATTGLSACVGGGKGGTSTAAAGEIPTDRMTYRTNPTSGDKVSLLGFGMMRLPSVDGRSAPKLRQASHCIGCNQCSVHCPQRIDIPNELHRIDAYVERLKQLTVFPKPC